MTDKPNTEKPNTDKPKRPRKAPIDFTRLTEGQAIQVQRIALVGANIGLAQQKVHEASLDAVRASFDPMIEMIEDEDLVATYFSALALAATPANARRIAQHPRCPSGVAAEISERLGGAPRAAEATRKPAADLTPGASSAQHK